MDGQNRTKLVDSKIVFPHGITLDLVSRLVYWADAYLDYIEVVDYEGKGRQTIIQGILVRELMSGGTINQSLPVRAGCPLQGTPSKCGQYGSVVNARVFWWEWSQREWERRERGYSFHSDGNNHLKAPFTSFFLFDA